MEKGLQVRRYVSQFNAEASTVIFNIRGTSGAGKSTLVRAIMRSYPERKEMFLEGRRNPIGQVLYPERSSFGIKPLFVPGAYTSPCGGCDNIKVRSDAFKLVTTAAAKGMDVLFEGLLICDEIKQTVELSKKFETYVLCIDLPVDECIVRINKRRQERNKGAKPVNPDNTTRRAVTIEKVMSKLEAQGVRTLWGTSKALESFIRQKLGLPDEGSF